MNGTFKPYKDATETKNIIFKMNCISVQRNKLYSLKSHNNYIIYCYLTFLG